MKKKSRELLVKEWMKQDPKPGDFVKILIPGETKQQSATILVDNDNKTYKVKAEYIHDEKKKAAIPLAWITKDPYTVGAYPFVEEQGRVRFINFDIANILGGVVEMRTGEARKSQYKEQGVDIEEFSFDPFIKDTSGKLVHYQRPLVWTLQDKQLLIESIYNRIEIGKIIVKKNSWKKIAQDVKSGKAPAFKDVVDGKQRLTTLISFIKGEFADLYGNYWMDLSQKAQREFGNYSGVSYGEMEEDATDAAVVSTFLKVNFAGVPQSKKHIEFVKSIKI